MGTLILITLVFVCLGLYGLYGAFAADTPKGQLQCFLMALLIFGCIALVWFLIFKYEEHKEADGTRDRQRQEEKKIIQQEFEEAVRSNEPGEPWRKRYATYPCPYCGHYKVRYAKWEDKQLSVAFWGMASDKLSCNYKCEHCNKMWE